MPRGMGKSNRRKSARRTAPPSSPRQARADKWSRIGIILIASLIAVGLAAGQACG